ncbi:MAG: hypothetical protein ACYSYM_11965, partial [Planctomycetota bacterium]
MRREYYSNSIENFLRTSYEEILGKITRQNEFSLEQTQRDAWIEEINILQKALSSFRGYIYFEYSIPRMGQRIDIVALIGPVISVLEFKI